jgi:hypothetical protein
MSETVSETMGRGGVLPGEHSGTYYSAGNSIGEGDLLCDTLTLCLNRLGADWTTLLCCD